MTHPFRDGRGGVGVKPVQGVEYSREGRQEPAHVSPRQSLDGEGDSRTNERGGVGGGERGRTHS